MSLLKQLSEGIEAYQAFVKTLEEKITKFEDEIGQEKRLGLLEAGEYYTQDKSASDMVSPDDTVEFKAPQEPVAKPVQHPSADRGPAQRIHLITIHQLVRLWMLSKQTCVAAHLQNLLKPIAQQVADAMKHMQNLSPQTAERIKRGLVNIWIPRAQAQMLSVHSGDTGVTSKVAMDPQRLAQAQKAAGEMSLAK